MKFVEIDLLGVYVPHLMIAAWIVTIVLRCAAARFGLLRHVWHPALFGSDEKARREHAASSF